VEITSRIRGPPDARADNRWRAGIGRQPAQALAVAASCRSSKGKQSNAQACGLGRSEQWQWSSAVAVQQLVEESGTSNSPWCLFGPEVETNDRPGGLRHGDFPNFSYVRLNDLRLKLRPDLLVGLLHPWAHPPPPPPSRRAELLTPQRPTTEPLGQGRGAAAEAARLSFFTTISSPSIPNAPNVAGAVVHPVPGAGAFLDIALRTPHLQPLKLAVIRSALTDLSAAR